MTDSKFPGAQTSQPFPYLIPDPVQQILRRHSHEVRNHLNILQLEAGSIDASTLPQETADQLKRILSQTSRLEAAMTILQIKCSESSAINIGASDVIQLWKMKVAAFEGRGRRINWPTVNDTRSLWINSKLLIVILLELTLAFWDHSHSGVLHVEFISGEDWMALELQDPSRRRPLSEELLNEAVVFLKTCPAELIHRLDADTGGPIIRIELPLASATLVGD